MSNDLIAVYELLKAHSLRFEMLDEKLDRFLAELKPLLIAAVPDSRLPGGVVRPAAHDGSAVSNIRWDARRRCLLDQFQKLVDMPYFRKEKRGFPKEITPGQPREGFPAPENFSIVPLSLLRNGCCTRAPFKPVGGEQSREKAFAATLEELVAEEKLVLTTLGELGLRSKSLLDVVATRAEARKYGVVAGGAPAPAPAPAAPAPPRPSWAEAGIDCAPAPTPAPKPYPRLVFPDRPTFSIDCSPGLPSINDDHEPEPEPATNTTPVVEAPDMVRAWGGEPVDGIKRDENGWDEDEHDDPFFEIAPENVIENKGVTTIDENS